MTNVLVKDRENRDSETAQEVKVLSIPRCKLEDLSSVPGAHTKVGRKNQVHKVV